MSAVLQAVLQFPGAHSALNPAGPQARIAEGLWNSMYATAIVVFILVMAALLWAAFRRRRAEEPAQDPARERRMRRVVAAAAGVTIVVLFTFLVSDISAGRAVTATPGKDAIQIIVTGHQWWWEVQYRDSVPQRWVTTANEIHVPVGRPVAVELRSTDVIHSFWPPNLTGKRDLIPGNENSLWFRGGQRRRLPRRMRRVLRPRAREDGAAGGGPVAGQLRAVAGAAARHRAYARRQSHVERPGGLPRPPRA